MAIVKTAISMDSQLFTQLNELAQRTGSSRSAILSLALREYTERDKNRILLEQINASCCGENDAEEEALLEAHRKYQGSLVDGEWK